MAKAKVIEEEGYEEPDYNAEAIDSGLTVIDLGKKAKAKFPDKYGNMSDLEVGRGFKQNNPDKYADYEDIEEIPSDTSQVTSPADTTSTEIKTNAPKQRSLVAKMLAGGESVLGVGASPVAKNILAPIAERLTSDPESKKRLQALRDPKNKRTAYASDVIEELDPTLSMMLFKDIPGSSWQANVGRAANRFIVDTLFDPLSYVGVGLETKLGRLLTAAHQVKQAGEPIKLTSKLAKDIAKEAGAAKPSPAIIQKFLKQGAPKKTFSQQVAAGERSILSLGPFGNEGAIPLPLATGELAGKLVKPLSLARRGALGKRAEEAAREVFSTKSGDPDFDRLISEYKSLADYRYSEQIKDAKVLRDKLDNLSRDSGVPKDVLSKSITSLGEQLKPKTKLAMTKIYGKQVFDIIDNHLTDKLVDAQVALKNAQRINDPQAVEAASKLVADYQGELNILHNKYQPPPGSNPQVDAVVKELRARNAAQLFKEQTSGIKTTELLSDTEYIPHIMTPDAKEAYVAERRRLGKLAPNMDKKKFNEELANSLRREFSEVKPVVIDAWKSADLITSKEARALKGKDGLNKMDELLKSGRISEDQFTHAVHTLTVDEVNALSRQGKIKSLGLYSGDIFHTDPIFHTTVRGIRGDMAVTAAEFFNQMKVRGLAIPEGTNPGWVNVRQKELEGFQVSPEIARVLNTWDSFNTNPSELKKFLAIYDKFHNWSKLWTLAPFPAYHTLNIIGNLWNNFLGGLTNPKRYLDAVRVQNKLSVKFVDNLGNLWSTSKLAQRAKELGVVDKGWYGGDIQKTIMQELEKGKLLTLSTRNKFLQKGLNVGKSIENNARMAHFIDRIKKGDTAEQAAMSVKKYLFDYGDLTNAERKYFNRGFFFYTWTRNNIPLQLQSLVQTPGKFALPYKLKHEIEKMTPETDERYLADYMQENFPMRIRYDKKRDEYTYFLLNRWLPASDITKLAHLHEVAAQMLAPLPKELLQQLWNYDYFFNKEIEKIPGQKDNKKFFGHRIPKRLTHGGKLIRLLNEIDKMTAEDTSIMDKVLGLTTGRTYQYNPTEGLINNTKRVRGELRDIKSVLHSELKRPELDQKEIDRILQMITEKVGEY